MKTLSVKNPLSYLICSGVKDVENRTFPSKYRGRIMIHSCGKMQAYEIQKEDLPAIVFDACRDYYNNGTYNKYAKALDDLYRNILFDYYDMDDHSDIEKLRIKNDYDPFFKTQCIVGEVDIIDCVKNSDSPFADNGSYHYILDNPELYDNPIIKINGKQGFWDYKK